jgi:hypothetical protein
MVKNSRSLMVKVISYRTVVPAKSLRRFLDDHVRHLSFLS